VVVKIRDPAFHTVTRSRSMRACSNNTQTLYRMARALFEKWREQHQNTPVRLLGMGVTGLQQSDAVGQAAGDGLDKPVEQDIDRVFDQINQRYGESKITHGQTLRRKRDSAEASSFFISSSRSSRRSILPTLDLGSSSRNSM